MRMLPRRYAEFRAVADLRGSDMSNIVHQYVIKLIREEKERDPEGFEEAVVKAIAEIKEQQEKKRAEVRNKRIRPIQTKNTE